MSTAKKAKTVPPDPPPGVSSVSEKALGAKGRDRSATYRNFLVPIDFSEHSRQTLESATQLAALTGAKVNILHVFQMPDYPSAFYQGLYIEHEAIKNYADKAQNEARTQLSLLAEQIRAKDMAAEPLLRVGNPYEEIINAAKEIGADLIVIGSHGYTGLGRLLLGSTAYRVIHYAPCPVLVVRELSGANLRSHPKGDQK
jgi:universal stress protein A